MFRFVSKNEIMETLIIQTQSKSTSKLLITLAKKLGENVRVLDKDTAEDLAFGKMMQSAKTGKTVSKNPLKQGIILGDLKGKVGIPDNFNDPLEDLKEYMF